MNVAILLLDTLRYDYAPQIPAFQELAKQGWVFERMYGSSTFTYSNMCSLRSGLYASRHGWRTWPKGGPFRADTTLERCLCQAGYHIDDTLKTPLAYECRKLKRPKQEPFFRFCWYLGIHDRVFSKGIPKTGVPPEMYKRCMKDTAQWATEAIELFSDSLILLLGDHGLGLQGDKLRGEGCDVGAGQVYDFRVRVPCVLAAPGMKPRTIEETHSIVDLMPTILDILDLPIPEKLDGKVVGQRTEPVLLEAQSPYSIWPSEKPNVFGATDGHLKAMITPVGDMCFDLQTDPAEKMNRPDLLEGERCQNLLTFIREMLK